MPNNKANTSLTVCEKYYFIENVIISRWMNLFIPTQLVDKTYVRTYARNVASHFVPWMNTLHTTSIFILDQ